MEPLPITSITNKLHTKDLTIEKNDKLFIFGRNSELSLAELISCYHSMGIEPEIKELGEEGIIVSSENNKHIDVNRTGSVLKSCKPIQFFPFPLDFDKIRKHLLKYFSDNVFIEDKAHWAISIYNRMDIENWADVYHQFQISIKKILKKINIKRAFFKKPQQEHQLSVIQILKKELLSTGFEIIIWMSQNGVVIAKTENVLDIEALNEHDLERPHRRPLLQIVNGLARSMINLVSVRENNHQYPIYDPFCGVGTILQESLLLGLSTMGSDIDAQCVKFTKKNIGFTVRKQLKRNGPSSKTDSSTNNDDSEEDSSFQEIPIIFQMDVINPAIEQFVDFEGSVVSEPDLLPPLKEYPSKKVADNLQNSFIRNYHDYLEGISQILKPGKIGVLVFPQIHVKGNRKMSMPVEHLLGAHNLSPVKYKVGNVSVLANFIHSWKDPIIERQIVVFERN